MVVLASSPELGHKNMVCHYNFFVFILQDMAIVVIHSFLSFLFLALTLRKMTRVNLLAEKLNDKEENWADLLAW